MATVEAVGLASKVGALGAELGNTITQRFFAKMPSDYQPKPINMKTASSPRPPALRLLKSVRMNVYLFVLRGNIWNTAAYQALRGNQMFAERATDQIPWGNFLARVMIDRIHYGNDSNDGHLNVVHGFEFLHTHREIDQLLGGGLRGIAGRAVLSNFLSEICERGRLHPDGSGGIPFTTVNTPSDVKITKVLRIDSRHDWGPNPATATARMVTSYPA